MPGWAQGGRRREVADSITYYAVYDDYGSTAEPRTVFRRVAGEIGEIDEIFAGDLRWKPSSFLIEAEHGDLARDFIEIDAAEAERIIARVRASVQLP
jgi:hypothetical protein